MRAKYIIRYEKMGGEWYYMIYQRVFFLFFYRYQFFTRCNTPETAIETLEELYQELK